MMVVGLKGEGYVGQIGGGCTVNEYSAHFSLWCMLSAPLLLGHDAATICTVIAQRVALEMDTDYRPFVDKMIKMSLEKLAGL